MVRFGIFKVDLEAREIIKQGRRIRLQELPFQFLAALLERPGQVVTREELIRRLWSEYAAIDVDNGLNTAAKKVRVALGDDADNPRFIETLPRRGYRFIAAVETVAAAADPPVIPMLPATSPVSVHDSPPLPNLPAETPISKRTQSGKFRRSWLAAPAALLLVGTAYRLITPSHAPATLRTSQLTHTGTVEPFSEIFTDGSRIYFDQRTGGQWSLAEVSVEGGTPLPIATPPGNVELRAISPNRSQLLATIAERNEEDA